MLLSLYIVSNKTTNPMNIALIGYGKMGQAIARVAAERGHRIVGIIDPKAKEASSHTLKESALKDADVAIDFSKSEGVEAAVRTCAKAGVPLVMGTTGWYDRMKKVRSLVEGTPKSGFLWSSNFSVGVQLYLKIIEAAARLFDGAGEYDIWGHELHHSGKADSPSGTAKSLEKILLSAIRRKKSVVENKLDRKRADSEIHFSSVRGGPVNFAHTIGFDSAADRVLITHEARNRDGYALGAVKAAEWLAGKTGWHDMDDYLQDVFPKS